MSDIRYEESKSKENIRMSRRMDENHRIIVLERSDSCVGAARRHVAGVVVVEAVVVFGGEEGGDVNL